MSDHAAPAEPSGAFSPRTVLVMLLVGVAAFVGFVALAAYSPELRDGRDGGGHALSGSAVGFAGLVRLLKESGVPVVISRGAIPDDGKGLLILTPGPETTVEDIKGRQGRRLTLLIASKWMIQPAPLRPGWVQKAGLLPPETAARLPAQRPVSFERRDEPRATLRIMAGQFQGLTYRTPIESLQTLARAPGQVLIADGAGRPVLMVVGDRTFLLSDPDLLNNQGLASLQRARFAGSIVESLRDGGPVVFDVTLNGFERSRSLLRLALGPPFLGATLCALAAALLMGAHAFARFGAPKRAERAFALGKRALADNAAALIHLARREPKMGARYADLTRRAVATAVAAGREADPAQMDAALDRLTADGEVPLSTLLAQASGATDESELMQAVRRLHHRRLEMTRERL